MTPKLVTEFIGSFFWVLIAALAGVYAGVMAPIAVGLGVAALVSMGAHVSGGHYNPAVTLAVFLRGRLEPAPAAAYIAVQMVGAAVGAVTARGVTGSVHVYVTGDHVTATVALAIEAMFTLVIVLAALHVSASKPAYGGSLEGLAVGCALIAATFAGAKVSGGAFNPAAALGPAVVSALTGGSVPELWWVHLAGPCIGGAAAALILRFQKQE